MARIAAGINSRQELADLVGTSYATIQRIEAGKDGVDYNLTAELRDKIVNVLNLNTEAEAMDKKVMSLLLDAQKKIGRLELELERLRNENRKLNRKLKEEAGKVRRVKIRK